MKGTKVASIPHPYGTRTANGWTPEGQEHYSNEKAWREAGLSERHDRHDYDKDRQLAMLAEIDRQHPIGKGGQGLALYPTLKPRRCHLFARRHDQYAEAKAAGIAIPDLLDRPRGQQTGALYTVLVIGEGVTSVKVGDVVVANAGRAIDRGSELGDGVYELITDVEYIDRRTHETERGHKRRMGDRERGAGGFVDAVLVDE